MDLSISVIQMRKLWPREGKWLAHNPEVMSSVKHCLSDVTQRQTLVILHLAAAGYGLILLNLGRTQCSSLVNTTTGSQQRDIWVEGQSWCWGQVCFLRMSMTPSHSLAHVCLLEPGSWLLKGKSHQEASSAFPVQVLMTTVCRTAQSLPTEQQMCPLAAFLKGNQF